MWLSSRNPLQREARRGNHLTHSQEPAHGGAGNARNPRKHLCVQGRGRCRGEGHGSSKKNEVSSKASEDGPPALHSSYKRGLTLTHKKMQGKGSLRDERG